ARPQEAHEVVALGGGGDGGTRVARSVFLTDGDRGGDAVDLVDFGFFHALQKLAGVGGERLNVAALAFGVDGVESERGFPRARDACDNGHAVVRDLEGDVLEIVQPRTADRDGFFQLDTFCGCGNFHFSVWAQAGILLWRNRHL